MQVKKQQLEQVMKDWTASELRKEYIKAILSPCLFNLDAEYIVKNLRPEEAQAGIKIAREISLTLDMQMIPPLWHKMKRS